MENLNNIELNILSYIDALASVLIKQELEEIENAILKNKISQKDWFNLREQAVQNNSAIRQLLIYPEQALALAAKCPELPPFIRFIPNEDLKMYLRPKSPNYTKIMSDDNYLKQLLKSTYEYRNQDPNNPVKSIADTWIIKPKYPMAKLGGGI